MFCVRAVSGRHCLGASVPPARYISGSNSGGPRGVFGLLWQQGLVEYDTSHGLDWEWQAMDGALTKAPLGENGTGPNPTDRGKRGTKRSLLTEGLESPVRWHAFS